MWRGEVGGARALPDRSFTGPGSLAGLLAAGMIPGMVQILLASGSPRRRAMLEGAVLDGAPLEVEVLVPDVDEAPLPGETPAALVERLAREKAAAVPADPGTIIVAGDTVVVLDGAILGKPVDADDARAMLAQLSGRTHAVVGGWCVRRGDHVLSGVSSTEIDVRPLAPDEIERYVRTGDPLDKAGAYGIQSGGGAFVSEVRGSFANVVGLPLGAVLPAIESLAAPR